MQEEIDALDRFMITLEWLMALQERHPTALNFGIVHVCFHDREALGRTYGARDASQMLCDLAQKLRQAFRKTDLVAKNGTDFQMINNQAFNSADEFLAYLKQNRQIALRWEQVCQAS